MRDFIIYISLILFVLYITRENNIWGDSKGTKKAKEDVKLEKSNQRKKRIVLWFLNKFIWISENIGSSLNSFKEGDYKYKIDRLRLRIDILNRNIKPVELVGIFKALQLGGSFVALGGIVATGSPFYLVFLSLIFAPTIFNMLSLAKISRQDEELERDFPDLFLILYSRLLQGTDARLAPTLNDYLLSLDANIYTGASKEVIKNFVLDLRSNIEIYGDDSMAVRKLRDKYKSVMVVNFCNLAVQALNGVDNSDKLLSFKLELNDKKVEQMRERADKLVKRGSRAVLVVYVILFQFLVISWVAKLSLTDGVGNIFGL